MQLRPVVVFPAADRRGGVERVALETLRHLAPRYPTTFVGHTLDTGDERPQIRHIDPKIPFWSAGALQAVAFRSGARRSIPRERSTVTISHGVNAPPGNVYHVHSVHRAWLRSGRATRLHGMKVPNSARYLLPRHQVLLALEADYFRHPRARRVIAVSRGLADDLADIYGVPDDIVTVIPNGYDSAQCNPQRRAAQRDELRALAGIPPDAIVALVVANELHRKGFGVLLDAVALTRDERLRIHLVGRTPLDLYESRIETLGLAGRVTYGGLVDDVAQAHALADLFVLPTQYETFAIAALEALASGLPVVITRGTPGAGERVEHDHNGLLLDDPCDAEELAALLQLALDGDRRARWSGRAPASVADLTWDRLMEQVEAVIREAA